MRIVGKSAAVSLFWGVMCVTLVVFADTGFAAHASLESAINKAGRQRMLTQRIVLTYCAEGLGVQPEVSRRKRMDAITLFDEQLAFLKDVTPNPDVANALSEVERLWRPFKAVAASDPDRDGAKRLLYANEDLLYAANKVVQLLQDVSNGSYARLVNIAGRQRMLSQRAAKFYMLQEWGFDTLTIRDELERARNEFVGGLEALRNAPESSKVILENLEEVQIHWSWFENALTLRGDHAFRLIVADSSEAILNRMDHITWQYAHVAE